MSNSLLGEIANLSSDMHKTAAPELIAIDRISIQEQIRTDSFDGKDSTIESMAASIKTLGLLTPILVRPYVAKDGQDSKFDYVLVSGERRLRGMILNGEKFIPALVRVLSDAKIGLVQLAENVERQNMSVLETSAFLVKLMDEMRDEGVADEDIRPEVLRLMGRDKTAANNEWLSNMLVIQTGGAITKAVAAETNNAAAIAATARLEKQSKEGAAKLKTAIDTKKKDGGKITGKDIIKVADKIKRDEKQSKGEAPRKNASKDDGKDTRTLDLLMGAGKPGKPSQHDGAGTTTATPRNQPQSGEVIDIDPQTLTTEFHDVTLTAIELSETNLASLKESNDLDKYYLVKKTSIAKLQRVLYSETL